jgi:serine/threonine protein phosphatase PrpC
MRPEIYGQSRPQEGRQHTQNQDAYLVLQAPVPFAAVCDGAGNAQAAAKRALGLLQGCVKEASLGQLLRDETWLRWARLLDSALLGGSESTLVAATLVGDQIVGAAVGDSRAYLVPFEGATRLLAEQAAKTRLGSGAVDPAMFRTRLQPRDVLALLSDGAWGPLGLQGLESAVRSAATKHFSDVPQALLDAASKRGRADDMTAVVIRVLSV